MVTLALGRLPAPGRPRRPTGAMAGHTRDGWRWAGLWLVPHMHNVRRRVFLQQRRARGALVRPPRTPKAGRAFTACCSAVTRQRYVRLQAIYVYEAKNTHMPYRSPETLHRHRRWGNSPSTHNASRAQGTMGPFPFEKALRRLAGSETVVRVACGMSCTQVAQALPASVVLMGAAVPYRNDFLPSFHRSRSFRAAALPSRHFQVPVNERLYARMTSRPRAGVPTYQVYPAGGATPSYACFFVVTVRPRCNAERALEPPREHRCLCLWQADDEI